MPEQREPSHDGKQISLCPTPVDALKALNDDYYYWGTKLTDTSFALSLAVIGANWAVFGSLDRILENTLSKWSILTILLSFGISLAGFLVLAELHRYRIIYVEQDPDRWKREHAESIGKSVAWPYTSWILNLATILRYCRTILPILGGIRFFFALLCGSRSAKPVASSGLPTAGSSETIIIYSQTSNSQSAGQNYLQERRRRMHERHWQ